LRIGVSSANPFLRLGLRSALERDPSLTVLWEAGSTEDADRLGRESPVDLLIIDAALLPERSGLVSLARREPAVLVVGAGPDLGQPPAGVTLVDSDIDPDRLQREAARAAALGAARAPRKSLRAHRREGPPPSRLQSSSLTPREVDVLRELQAGRTSREIAVRLSVTPATVNKHVQRILHKLRARNRTQAALLMGGHARRVHHVALIDDLLRRLGRTEDALSLVTGAVSGAIELTDADGGALLWWDRGRRELRVIGESSFGDAAAHPNLAAANLVVERAATVVSGRLRADGGRGAPEGLEWLAVVPVPSADGTAGVLAVKSRQHRLESEQIEAMEMLAASMGPTLQKVLSRPSSRRAVGLDWKSA
jgi:DNA-binding NarL/FixJ family response regulator